MIAFFICLPSMLLWSSLPQAVWFAVVLGFCSHISISLSLLSGHAVVSLTLSGGKAVALLGVGIRHDNQEVQPKPQRKRPEGVRTGAGARAAALFHRALVGLA
jgi:hypothetical protein